MATRPTQLDGVLMVLLGSCWFSVMSLLIKGLGPEVPTSWVALLRSAVMVPCIWVLLRKEGVSIKSRNGFRLILRALFGSTAMLCVFWALPRMPIADASVLFHASPLYAALWGVLFMGEKLDKPALFCIGAACVGILVTFRPALSFAGLPYYAALIAGLLSSLAYATIKSLSKTEPAHRIIFYFGLVGTILFLPPALASGWRPNPRQWGVLTLIGVLATIGQIFLTTGIHRAPVSKATFGALFIIVLNTAGGWLVWGEKPDAQTWLGCALVAGGILGLTREVRRRLMVTLAQ